jgi:hypothetical protein
VFILRDLLPPLQAAFSNTTLGRERATWFTYTLLAVVVPFTSSMSANLLRTLTTLFGLALSQRRFYTFRSPDLGDFNLTPAPRNLSTAWSFHGGYSVGKKLFNVGRQTLADNRRERIRALPKELYENP